MLENSADVSRLTDMGLAQDEAPRVEQRSCKREGGVITSVITDVNGVAAKTKTRVIAIGQDASLITSDARSRAWSRNDEGGRRFWMTQTERGGDGAEECGKQMQDAKKVEQLLTSHCPRS